MFLVILNPIKGHCTWEEIFFTRNEVCRKRACGQCWPCGVPYEGGAGPQGSSVEAYHTETFMMLVVTGSTAPCGHFCLKGLLIQEDRCADRVDRNPGGLAQSLSCISDLDSTGLAREQKGIIPNRQLERQEMLCCRETVSKALSEATLVPPASEALRLGLWRCLLLCSIPTFLPPLPPNLHPVFQRR